MYKQDLDIGPEFRKTHKSTLPAILLLVNQLSAERKESNGNGEFPIRNAVHKVL